MVFFALLLLFSTFSAVSSRAPLFEKVTESAGLPTGLRKKKYGGPSVVDLDRDGWPDLLFCNHDNYYSQVFFNNAGVFTLAPFHVWTDNHGMVPVPVSSRTPNMRFTLSLGGAFGKYPTRPALFEVNPSRQITNITVSAGVDRVGGRGRTAIFMDLSFENHGDPDVIFMHAKPNDDGPSHYAYQNFNGSYSLHPLSGFSHDRNWYGSPIDINNDCIMEVAVHYGEFSVYELVAPFMFTDITKKILPSGIERHGVVAIAELDYDNDGDFDLYVARTKSGDLKWSPGKHFDDYLFRNDEGKFVDVTDAAGIPRGTTARGVTVADFNNDGHVDIFVTQYIDTDIMLLNNGDGTFRQVDGLIYRPNHARGDNAQAIDYDGDGMMDIISSQGDQHDTEFGGNYELFRNTLPHTSSSRFMKVRVGNAPDKSATPLHALVVVSVGGGARIMSRRVGSRGAAVSRSYVETLHFGLGSYQYADLVKVIWTSGIEEVRRSRVHHSQTVVIGCV